MKICYNFNQPAFHCAQRFFPPYIKFMHQSQCFFFSGLRFGAAWIETVWWEIWIFHEAKGTWRNHANLKSDAFPSSYKRGFFAIFWGVTDVFNILSTMESTKIYVKWSIKRILQLSLFHWLLLWWSNIFSGATSNFDKADHHQRRHCHYDHQKLTSQKRAQRLKRPI